jgi:hypothetical protein
MVHLFDKTIYAIKRNKAQLSSIPQTTRKERKGGRERRSNTAIFIKFKNKQNSYLMLEEGEVNIESKHMVKVVHIHLLFVWFLHVYNEPIQKF